MKVFFLSGIGADCRLFTYIPLPGNFEKICIEWIEANPHETIKEYAIRLFAGKCPTEPFILIGLSLGGIIAIEIAKVYRPVCTIIISSVSTSSALPAFYSLAGKLNLHRFLLPVLWKMTATLKHFLFMKSWKNKNLMRKVIWSGDNRFIRWGRRAVLLWKNEEIPTPLVHIHGTRDEVFPLKFTKPTHILSGGHMLVVSHSEKINGLIYDILKAHS